MTYNKLRGRIIEKFGSQKAFAPAIGMNASTLSLKMNNGAEWTREEIVDACSLLDIPIEEAHVYFFAR